MKKVVFAAVMLTVISGSTMAEWTELGSTEEGVRFVDLSTIRKSGTVARMWSMTNYSTSPSVPTMPEFLSLQTLSEYDCESGKTRVIGSAFYSGQMGGGKSVYSDTEPLDWRYAAPGTTYLAEWEIACGKMQ